jgi:hypothetical protein
LEETIEQKEAVMTAKVELVSVSVRRVCAQRPNYAQYDGVVRLRATSQGIGFQYAVPFKDEDSIPNAILRATNMLFLQWRGY